jgi:hypothetical protein
VAVNTGSDAAKPSGGKDKSPTHTPSLRKRIGAKLKMHDFARRPLAALHGKPGCSRRSQAFALPARFGIVDPAVDPIWCRTPPDTACAERSTYRPSAQQPFGRIAGLELALSRHLYSLCLEGLASSAERVISLPFLVSGISAFRLARAGFFTGRVVYSRGRRGDGKRCDSYAALRYQSKADYL